MGWLCAAFAGRHGLIGSPVGHHRVIEVLVAGKAEPHIQNAVQFLGIKWPQAWSGGVNQ